MKKFLKPVHIQAIVIYLIYTVSAKVLIVKGTLSRDSFFSYVFLSFFSSLFAVIFLFLFSHEDFFKFAKIIEESESKKEKKLLKTYVHFGKSITTLIVGVIAGPLFTALTARILIPRSPYKYLIIIIASIVSSILWLGFLRGAFSQFSFSSPR